jgi:hypothetical protein
MAAQEIELRVAALEEEVGRLKEQLAKSSESKGDWVHEIYGSFENDPLYEKAMRLGREYRESLRPGAAKKRPRKAGKKPAKGRKR